jgi:DNA helicase IV
VAKKQQSFADKVKKLHREEGLLSVRVIKAYRSPKGTVKFFERFVKVPDQSKLDSIDITRS